MGAGVAGLSRRPQAGHGSWAGHTGVRLQGGQRTLSPSAALPLDAATLGFGMRLSRRVVLSMLPLRRVFRRICGRSGARRRARRLSRAPAPALHVRADPLPWAHLRPLPPARKEVFSFPAPTPSGARRLAAQTTDFGPVPEHADLWAWPLTS